MKPTVQGLFDHETWTITYVVWDGSTGDAVIIDPVLDYDPASSRVATKANERVAAVVASHELKVHLILETHAHADHLSGSQDLKQRYPAARIGIGARIVDVQQVFKGLFNLGDEFAADGSQFDLLLADGSVTRAGKLDVKTLFTPGHTPACASYLIGDAVFTGDALFMPDYGTGRCDFPSGSAADLYKSIQSRLYTLPDETRVFVGHDYQPNGRSLLFESSIGEEKRSNHQLKAETTEEQYVAFRTARDQQLTAPRLLLPSVQVNMRAGRLPSAEANGVSYLKIPIRP
ncbi:MAG: MBL fold metallo-hydrolase [Gammaproteobacteria bacterium]|nr:MBL fold metallo-hydrolase [Gammaproteobacteria bacterium]MBI5616039.1 MBL fold metallo-hydrolase [Gammaproteobacteria bacterium]